MDPFGWIAFIVFMGALFLFWLSRSRNVTDINFEGTDYEDDPMAQEVILSAIKTRRPVVGTRKPDGSTGVRTIDLGYYQALDGSGGGYDPGCGDSSGSDGGCDGGDD